VLRQPCGQRRCRPDGDIALLILRDGDRIFVPVELG
jgi:hypothetical protein